MQIRTDATVHETIFEETLENGLQLHILPKPGFAKTEIALTIAYGSTDRDVLLKGHPEVVSFPDGTAHFLEHMLFESENENISNQFSAVGASVNAYTSPTKTSYFFSTTNGAKTPLELLLSLVFFPKFNADLVDKERQIIAKEIQMYQDDLDQMIYEDTLNGLFKNHPVKADIAGSETSIASIDEKWLHLAYETFYHPTNAHLVVVGDVDPETILSIVQGHPFNQLHRVNLLVKRVPQKESNVVAETSIFKKKDVKTDMLMFGIKLDKEKKRTPLENDIDEIKLVLLFDNVLGKTSKVYRTLMDKQLINDTFEFSITSEADYGFIVIYTESKKPAATKKAILQLLKHLPEQLEDEHRFQIAKRKMLGNFIQTFDHVSALSSFLTEYFVSGVDLFQLFQIVDTLSFADLKNDFFGYSSQSVSCVHYHG